MLALKNALTQSREGFSCGALSAQNTNFKENCMVRGSPCNWVILPKVPFLQLGTADVGVPGRFTAQLAFGNPKYGVLNKLKASHRNSRFRPSWNSGKTRATATSVFTSPGPYMLLRLQVPSRATVAFGFVGLTAHGTANCVASNQNSPGLP